ncbi:hypothetical protein JCM5353_007204 [Sporobolomyces roseus]
MAIDELIALIVATDNEDVKESLIPVLKKADVPVGKGKGKDQTGDASASSSSAVAPPPPSSTQLLTSFMNDGKDPLDLLHPYEKTVGYLYILNARLGVQSPDLRSLMPRVYAFMSNFEQSQARLVYEQITLLTQRLGALASAYNDLSIYFEPYKLLVQRWAPTGTLTSFHSTFLRQIILSKAYAVAKDILYVDITDVDKSLFPIKYQDHLVYHYLGGTILALLGDYVRASDLLEICASAPGPAVSLIQLDAYKKLVLVQLLAYGKTLPLPKYTTQTASNAYKTLCTPYNDYVFAFSSLDKMKVANAREKARETFTRDHNLGLVSLVDESLRRRIIQKLTMTWSTLSLGQLTNLLGMDGSNDGQVDEVEREVMGMVSNGQLFATISTLGEGSKAQDKIVKFEDDPEPYLSHETVQRVTKAIQKAKVLDHAWSQEGERMEEGKEFVTKMYQSLNSGGGAGGPGLPAMMGGFSDDYDIGSIGGFGGGGGGGRGGGDSTWADDGGDSDILDDDDE